MAARSRVTIGRVMILIAIIAVVLAVARVLGPVQVFGVVLDFAIAAGMARLVTYWCRRRCVGDQMERGRRWLAWTSLLLCAICCVTLVRLIFVRSPIAFYSTAVLFGAAITCTVGTLAFMLAMNALTLRRRGERRRLELWSLVAVAVGVTSCQFVMYVGFLWVQAVIELDERWSR